MVAATLERGNSTASAGAGATARGRASFAADALATKSARMSAVALSEAARYSA
jgi:hypothetical protein